MNQSKTERALIARDQRGFLTVLATDGPWIAGDCENVSTGAEDIGLVDDRDCPGPGLFLFTGFGRVEHGGAWDGAYEPEVVYHGTVRPVRPDEAAELFAMTPPDPAGFEVPPATPDVVPAVGIAVHEDDGEP